MPLRRQNHRITTLLIDSSQWISFQELIFWNFPRSTGLQKITARCRQADFVIFHEVKQFSLSSHNYGCWKPSTTQFDTFGDKCRFPLCSAGGQLVRSLHTPNNRQESGTHTNIGELRSASMGNIWKSKLVTDCKLTRQTCPSKLIQIIYTSRESAEETYSCCERDYSSWSIVLNL